MSDQLPSQSLLSTSLARDNALAAGVSAINGLPILPLTFRSNLDTWYKNNIQGGVGSFTIAANGFEDVGQALEKKLRWELTSPSTDVPSTTVPEPTSILGILLGGGGLACLKRRQRFGLTCQLYLKPIRPSLCWSAIVF